MPTAFLLMALLLAAAAASATAEAAGSLVVTHGCGMSCGGVVIPYPFGIGGGCFRKGFEIECVNNGRPVLAGTSIQVVHLSADPAESLVLLPVGWMCYNASNPSKAADFSYAETEMNKDGVYRISNTHNELVVLGCNTMAYTASGKTEGGGAAYPYAYYTGCMSYCNDSASARDGLCAGVGCCRVDIPPGLTGNYFEFHAYNHSTMMDYSPCDYAFLVDRNNYTFRRSDLLMDTNRTSPVWLDWAIRGDVLSCTQAAKTGQSACVSAHSDCVDSTNGPGYNCKCSKGYDGNAYLADGCTSAIGGALVIAFTAFVIIIRKEKRKTKEFYEKNGGLTLEKAKVIKLFKKEELKPVLKISNLIGKGGFGEVYKGVVDDILVAVKKPISGNVLENKQFANEVIIQSQVIHKNIVRLIGCCLEVDTPMLVYEFISKGSLHDILHRVDNKEPLNLDVRLSIVAESAHGLAYMHSQAHTKILHGDVKPANILLDDSFVPKISDFGISRLIAIDKEHTANVIGDMTYMDPVYLQTGLLTEKSDVYSFGVVILEVISRKKATHSDNNSLVTSFLECHKEKKKATELFDKEIATTGNLELLDTLAGIAVGCLNLDVDQRPSMTDVVARLLTLNRSRMV
uniref:Protein kinase domain-containing protein n=1 Tax=Triticum urartu TaxID=4572 RepID=A0A8R7NWB4_TRIUA